MESDPFPSPAQRRRSSLVFVSLCFALICLGSIIGYAIPVVDIEHRNQYAEAGRHFLNIIDFAIIGAGIGILMDGFKAGFPTISSRGFTLKTLFLIVAMDAILVAIIKGYIQIAVLLNHPPS